MDKEKIIEILEDYEFFVDDDFGGHYEHINCSQKALTPLGIVEILDYISNLEQQVQKQKEAIDKATEKLNNFIGCCKAEKLESGSDYLHHQYWNMFENFNKQIKDILKEVSE